MLISCRGHKQSPCSLACVHLMESAGRTYFPFPRQEGEEGAPHLVCEDCVAADAEKITDVLYEICLDCARDILARHYCGECLLEEEPCEYHGTLGAWGMPEDE